MNHDSSVGLEVSDEDDFLNSGTFVSWLSFIENQRRRNPELSKRFAITRNLEFSDPQVEAQFLNHRGSRDTLFSNILLSIAFMVVVAVSIIMPHSKFDTTLNPNRLWLVYLIEASQVLSVVAIFCVFWWAYSTSKRILPSGDCFQAYVIQNHFRIWFHFLNYLCVSQSLYFFVYLLSHNVEYVPHIAIMFAIMGTCHYPMVKLSLTGLCQLLFFGVCGGAAGFADRDVVAAIIILFFFGLIGLCSNFSLERDSRIVYAHQQISLETLRRNALVMRDLAKQAQEASLAKSLFIANMSHEIRTPLHGVITALDLLKSSGALSFEQSDYVQVAENSSGLLLDVLNNVLAISKLQAEKVALDSVPINLRTIVETVAAVFSQIAAKKGVEVAAYVPPTCPVYFLSDPVRLKQILFNLVSNAVKFTPKGSVQLNVSLDGETDEDATLTIVVQDTGIGVAKESLHLMFQRFSQVDQSSTRRFQGTGLGLALVYEFTKLFGGHVSVHSDGLDCGTRFSLTLKLPKFPNTPSAPLPVSPLLDPDLSSHDLSSRWLAVIFHQSRSIGEMCQKYLEHFGFACTLFDQHLGSHSQMVELGARARSLITSPNNKSIWRVPCVIVLDHAVVTDPETLAAVRLIEETFRKQNSFSLYNVPLFALILDNPVKPGETCVPYLTNWHTWHLKKPFGLSKLSDAISKMASFLLTQQPKKELKLKSSRWDRRFSDPDRVFFDAPMVPPKKGLSSIFGKRKSIATWTVPGDHNETELRQISSKWSTAVEPNMTPDSDSYSDLSNFKFGGDTGPTDEKESQPAPGPLSTQHTLISSEPLPMPESSLLQSLILDQTDSDNTNNSASSPLPVSFGTAAHAPTATSTDSVTVTIREDLSAADASKRILVADDNSVNRNLTVRVLTKAGFTCVAVENGLEAVQAATTSEFSVIFMDITMPVMDGCEATRVIQSEQDKKGMKRSIICALSAADSERFSDAQFDFVLNKPIKSADLVQAAHDLSEKYLTRAAQ